MDNRQPKMGFGPENSADCQMLMFSLDRRVGRIRDVAQKWIAKPRAADKRGYETIVAKATGAVWNGQALPTSRLTRSWCGSGTRCKRN